MKHYCSLWICESRYEMVSWCARNLESYKSQSKSSVERVQRAGARAVTQNFLCTRRERGICRLEIRRFVCSSLRAANKKLREVGNAARAQHILAKREHNFSTFSCFQLYSIWDPESWGCGAAFCSNALLNTTTCSLCSLTHSGCFCGGKARCLLLLA